MDSSAPTTYFVRHGQSLSNVGGITMAHHAIPLTEVGRQQAHALALMLPQSPSAVLTSPFDRARDTAAPYCARTGCAPLVQEALREFETVDPDLLQGMTGEQRRPIADAYWDEADPQKRMGARAETFAEFDQRVTAFMSLALPALADQAVVFGHGMWMARLVWKQLGFGAVDELDMKSFRLFQLGFPMPNGAAYQLIETAPQKWLIRADEAILRAMRRIAGKG